MKKPVKTLRFGKMLCLWYQQQLTQLTFTCSKLTVEKLAKSVKYVQS